MTKENKVFLRHILDCIGKTESYLAEFDYAKFQSDAKTIDAVVRNVEVIGEAASNLSRDFRSSNSSIEWQKIMQRATELFTATRRLIWKSFGTSREVSYRS